MELVAEGVKEAEEESSVVEEEEDVAEAVVEDVVEVMQIVRVEEALGEVMQVVRAVTVKEVMQVAIIANNKVRESFVDLQYIPPSSTPPSPHSSGAMGRVRVKQLVMDFYY